MKQNLLLIACFFYGFAAAQQFSFNSFTVREGLSNNTVTAFVKDFYGLVLPMALTALTETALTYIPIIHQTVTVLQVMRSPTYLQTVKKDYG